MALTPEAKVKRDVAKILDIYNVYYFFPPANGYGRQGIPDIICCIHGHFLAVECKAGKGTTTVLQDREIAKIVQNGGTALVVNENNMQELHDLLKKLEGIYDKF
jgi:Holliday junction resolvase